MIVALAVSVATSLAGGAAPVAHVDTTAPPTYYVSAQLGHDAGSGTAQAPWRTVQYAVDHALPGATVVLAAGRYQPFVVDTPDLTIRGAGPTSTVVRPADDAHDLIAVHAAGTTISALGALGCRAQAVANDGYENGGSSGIAIYPGADGTTVTDVKVTSVASTNQYGATFGCFAISARSVDDVQITHSLLVHNGYGVFLFGGGRNTVIADNAIRRNKFMIRNTPVAGDDFGAVGIGFTGMSASPGPVARNNRITGNVADSLDYGTDGGGFEIYSASNVTIVGNRLHNNENVIETGGSGDTTCANNTFADNIATGRWSDSALSHSIGMFIRCAAGMQITQNSFTGIDWWVFDVDPLGGDPAMTDGLTITGNTVTQGQDMVISVDRDPAGQAYRIASNSYSYQGWFGKDWYGHAIASAADLTAQLQSNA